MVLDAVLRFLLGGAIVSAFAAIGELFEPKSFAGIFGAAPSVAVASLGLAFAKEGSSFVAIEGRSAMAGAIALFLYSVTCTAAAKRKPVPVWLSAGAAWTVWFAAAFAMWRAGCACGVFT